MIQRLLIWMSTIKWSLVHASNRFLWQYFGLRLVNASYYDELLRMRYEHFFMQHHIESLEEELEELRPAEESEVQA